MNCLRQALTLIPRADDYMTHTPVFRIRSYPSMFSANAAEDMSLKGERY